MSDSYDFGGDAAQTYSSRCSCGTLIEVSAQKDHSGAEYGSDIYVKCGCGESVYFDIPVN